MSFLFFIFLESFYKFTFILNKHKFLEIGSNCSEHYTKFSRTLPNINPVFMLVTLREVLYLRYIEKMPFNSQRISLNDSWFSLVGLIFKDYGGVHIFFALTESSGKTFRYKIQNKMRIFSHRKPLIVYQVNSTSLISEKKIYKK